MRVRCKRSSCIITPSPLPNEAVALASWSPVPLTVATLPTQRTCLIRVCTQPLRQFSGQRRNAVLQRLFGSMEMRSICKIASTLSFSLSAMHQVLGSVWKILIWKISNLEEPRFGRTSVWKNLGWMMTMVGPVTNTHSQKVHAHCPREHALPSEQH